MKELTEITPDFDELFDHLKLILQNKGTWKDLLETSMGTTVMDMFAASGVSNQLHIETALREAFLISAKRDSSIIASTRSMGVKITRKESASVTANLTNHSTDAVFITPYSAFTIGNRLFFNRLQLVLAPNQNIEKVHLFEGTVKTQEIDLDLVSDLDYYMAVVDELPYTVSNRDIRVYTKHKQTNQVTMFYETEAPLWEHESHKAIYYENTDSKGRPVFIFGNDVYGKRLAKQSVLYIDYVITEGAATNNAIEDNEVVYVDNQSVYGHSTNAEGGANQKHPSFYKKFAPHLSRKQSLISKAEYKAAINLYPGVADSFIQTQRDIDPTDPTWMNVIRVCVLPENTDTWGGANPNPISSAWNTFKLWIEDRIHSSLVIQTWNPEKINVEVELEVAIAPALDPNKVETTIIENILKLFEKKPGILGKTLTISDLIQAGTLTGVDYVNVVSPYKNVEVNSNLYYLALQATPKVNVKVTDRINNDFT